MERTRRFDELREIKITNNFIKHAEGSVLIEMGDTKVICTASVEDKVPLFKKGTGEGWITAEYSMLPRATIVRNVRDVSKLRLSSRAAEIQRLIGRALRAAVDTAKLGGEYTITIDCDVIQADGGTRTASITGGFIALYGALQKMVEMGILEAMPEVSYVAAVSVGIVDGEVLLDLCYDEDSRAEVDMNVVMNHKGELIEVQGTGEHKTFSRSQLNQLLDLAERGIKEIIEIQKLFTQSG